MSRRATFVCILMLAVFVAISVAITFAMHKRFRKRVLESFAVGAPYHRDNDIYSPAAVPAPAPAPSKEPEFLPVPDAGMDVAALQAMSPPELLEAAQTNAVGM